MISVECIEGGVDLDIRPWLFVEPYFVKDTPACTGFTEDTAHFVGRPSFESDLQHRAQAAGVTARFTMYTGVVENPSCVEAREDGGHA